jgi:putative transposase
LVCPHPSGDREAEAKGNLRAGVDLGIVNLATVYVEDGTYSRAAASQYEYCNKKIRCVQKLLAKA